MTMGFLKIVHSSWIPPESEMIIRLERARARKSKYDSGSVSSRFRIASMRWRSSNSAMRSSVRGWMG